MPMNPPHISVIVPLLNESGELSGLFATLSAQEGVSFELLLCDGGSHDGTQELGRKLAAAAAFAVSSISCPRGRGVQMNAGAAAARGDLLLFLHADSRFTRSDALQTAASAYRERSRTSASPVAARFRLSFRRTNQQPSLAYRFYESKARLERADCIRGDQGFLLHRSLFEQLGDFDTSLPFLEDIRLAEKVAATGRWLLLPAEISTSARRFETEGLYERQVVNAIITNAVAAGWLEFFNALPGLYRCAGTSGRLLLLPLLEGIRDLLAAQPPAWRRSFWMATGRHVAGNIWQLFFWLDVRSAYAENRGPDDVNIDRLLWFQRNLERSTRSIAASAVTAVAVWVWFRVILITHRLFTRTS